MRGVHDRKPAGFLRHLLAVISATNRKPLLASVKVPVSIVHGDGDPVFPVEAARQLASAIPGARLMIVPGMGQTFHLPFGQLCSMPFAASIGPEQPRGLRAARR